MAGGVALLWVFRGPFRFSYRTLGSSGRRLANRRMEERAIRNLFICDIGVGAGPNVPPPLLPAPPRLLGELKVGRRTSDYPNTHYLESPISISHPQFISGRWWVVLTTLREPQMGNSNCWKRMLWKCLYHFWNFDLFRLVGRVAKVVKLFQYHEFSKRFSKTFLKFDTLVYISVISSP